VQLQPGGGDGAPAFSPDGRQVAFDRGDAIWVAVPGSRVVVTAGGRRVSRTSSGTVRFTLPARGTRVTVSVTPPGGTADRTTRRIRRG
jgi:WD40-like Beta Propeller Repeat